MEKWLIIAGIILAAALALRALWRRVANSTEMAVLRYFARAAKNGDINDRLSETPKSLSSMDKIFLPQILQDFPEFNWNEFKAVISASICNMLRAIDARDIGLMGTDPVQSPRLREAVGHVLAGTQIPFYRDVKVHDTVIKRYFKKEGTCYIICESAVEYYGYVEENGRVVRGYKDRKRQEVYETELVYIQDAERAPGSGGGSVGVVCPNCGAPVTNLGAKRCEYCGSAVEPLNLRAWKIQSIRGGF